MADMKKGLFLLVLTWCVGNASAAGALFFPGVLKFSSEILVAPLGSVGKSNASSASESRRKARASTNDVSPPVAEKIIVVVPDEEDGVLSPYRMGSPADNRGKARDYSTGTDSGSPANVRILSDVAPDSTETNQNNLEKNSAKARRYSDGMSGNGGKAGTFIKIGTSVGVVGADGVVVLVCDETNNIAGRIGDDSQSGNIFSVVVNGKLVKARCR